MIFIELAIDKTIKDNLQSFFLNTQTYISDTRLNRFAFFVNRLRATVCVYAGSQFRFRRRYKHPQTRSKFLFHNPA